MLRVIIVFVVIAVSSFVTAQQQVHMADLVKQNGLYVLIASGAAFTGEVVGKGSRQQLKNGKFNGLTSFYRADGSLKYQAEYKNNAAHGFVKRFYPNGQMSYLSSRWKGREYDQKTTCFNEQGTALAQCNKYALTAGEFGQPN